MHTMNELIDTPQSSGLVQWITGALVAIPAAFFTVQKLIKGWSADRADRAGFDATTAMTSGMVHELERLQALNRYLSEELGKMQKVVAEVAGENLRLNGQIADLQSQISRMLKLTAAPGASQ